MYSRLKPTFFAERFATMIPAVRNLPLCRLKPTFFAERFAGKAMSTSLTVLSASSQLFLQKGLQIWLCFNPRDEVPPQANFFCRKVCWIWLSLLVLLLPASSQLFLQKGLLLDFEPKPEMGAASSQLFLQKGLRGLHRRSFPVL